MPRPLVLVDSSIWIDHINQHDDELVQVLRRGRAVMHPMVYGEVALGSIRNRDVVLRELRAFPQLLPSSHVEVLAMIERLELFGQGVGLVDVHLLAAAQISRTMLFTRDKRLRKQAVRLELAYEPY